MDALLRLFSEIIGALYDAIFQKKHTGKEIPWERWLRLLGVGFSGFAVLFFLFFFAIDRDELSGAIFCSSPFFLIGAVFLVMAFILRNDQINYSGKEIPRGRWLIISGVGISMLATFVFIIFIAGEGDLLGAIYCSSPFFLIGAVLLAIGILRRNNTWKS